jgi:hypothetical protein
MDEFDDEEKVISQCSCQTKWTNSSNACPDSHSDGVEHCVEAAAVQVRILFRPHKSV